MSKDTNQCHHEPKPKRPTLKLKPAPDAYDYDHFWNQEQKIKAFLAGNSDVESDVRDHSRQLAEKRQQRKELAEERRKIDTFYAEVAEQRRLAADSAQEMRAQRERWDREDKRKRWHRLLKRAVELGLQPSQDWDEKKVLSLIEAQQFQIRSEKERVERRRQLEEMRQLELLAAQEAFEDQFDYIPGIVKFGDFDRDDSCWWDRGDRASFNRGWQGQRWSYHASTQKRLRDEHMTRTGLVKWGRVGKGPRNPQKQPRTWEAAAPHKWRRREQCDQRWNHLFI